MVKLIILSISCIVGKARSKKKGSCYCSSTSGSSRISTADMERIVEQLKNKQHRDSTAKTYLSVWRQFNNFVISLDRKPALWEDRVTLFIAYLVEKGMQSVTIKSYVSAIKKTLTMDGYNWDDKLVLVRSLVRACRIVNDTVTTRLPIQCSLLEVLLFELQRYFTSKKQGYLEILYQTMFAICYYGMMRIGEVTRSPHVLKACNVHLATNKDKLLLILHSSKTHDEGSRPQKIKITSNRKEKTGNYAHQHFCPFKLMRKYMELRGGYRDTKEQFFVFRDLSPVTPQQARLILNTMIQHLNLNSRLYGMHSFRIGRTTDLTKFNYSIEEIKVMGRWRSNVVFKYIR